MVRTFNQLCNYKTYFIFARFDHLCSYHFLFEEDLKKKSFDKTKYEKGKKKKKKREKKFFSPQKTLEFFRTVRL